MALRAAANGSNSFEPRNGESQHSHGRTIGITASAELYEELDHRLSALGFDVFDATQAPAQAVLAHIVEAEMDGGLEITQNHAKKSPVILLANQTSFDFRIAAARAGAETVLPLPFDSVELSAWLSDFDAISTEKHTILIVDDDELASMAYALSLEAAGMKTHVVTKPGEALDAVNTIAPDLVLMDLHMPDINGIEIAKVLRQSRQHLSLPIMFLSAERDAARQQDARRIGGDDFMLKPINLEDLTSAVALRADRAKALREVMQRDSMTGLLNHARFKERLASEVERSQRTGSSLSVSIIDLDHFKQVNDVYGHQAGDRVIQTLAHFITGALRKTDVVARYGGEEFAIIFLDTDPVDARAVLNKMRVEFGNICFDFEQGNHQVTLSAGLSGAAGFADADAVLRAADEALYAAKRNGRNQVTTAPNMPALAIEKGP